MAARAQRRTKAKKTTTRSASRRPVRPAARASFRPRIAARPSDEIEGIYIVGLRNAHAVEKEALQVMQRQVDRIAHYPEMVKRLREHIKETEGQIERLDRILERHDATPSMLKDIVTQIMGNTAAVAHAAAGDEILKNAFANQALEAYEIAAYKSLITMATHQGDSKAVPLLTRTLGEEERMAKWVDASIAKLTLAYLEREEKGLKADR